AEDRLGAGGSLANAPDGAIQRSELDRSAAGRRIGIPAGHVGAEALARRQTDRAPDQADAENADPHGRPGSPRPR
ncbi:MAG: hypothetical protein H0W09_00355, partial [Solirubrobacterales bacterium]|nr:hypothetical protein [Solirubrobacterales bacterium]